MTLALVTLVVWLLLWRKIATASPEQLPELQGWTEAASGANWPSSAAVALRSPTSGVWFAGVLAARAAASVAAVAGSVIAVVWFLLGGLERLIMHVSRREMTRVFNAQLTPALADLLQEMKPGLVLDDADRAALLSRADELSDQFEKDVERLSPKE